MKNADKCRYAKEQGGKTGNAQGEYRTPHKLVLNNNWREVLAKARQKRDEARQAQQAYRRAYVARMMKPVPFQIREPVPPGGALELLAENIDSLLEHAEEIAQNPEMAECREFEMRVPLARKVDLAGALMRWRTRSYVWTRVSTEGHNLYVIAVDGSPFSGACYTYTILDPVTKMLGTVDNCPELSEAAFSGGRIKRAKVRPRAGNSSDYFNLPVMSLREIIMRCKHSTRASDKS